MDHTTPILLSALMARFLERASSAYRRRRQPVRAERYRNRASAWRWQTEIARCAS